MISAETRAVIDRAKRMYANGLQTDLESQHRDRFVAIEPESGEYFLGDTFDEAVTSARAIHPSRLSHHPDRASRRLSPRAHAVPQ